MLIVPSAFLSCSSIFLLISIALTVFLNIPAVLAGSVTTVPFLSPLTKDVRTEPVRLKYFPEL